MNLETQWGAAPPPGGSKVRAYIIALDPFFSFLKRLDGTRRIKIEGVPPDARPRQVTITPEGHVAVLVESETFLALPKGSAVPSQAIGIVEVKDEAPSAPTEGSAPTLKLVEP